MRFKDLQKFDLFFFVMIVLVILLFALSARSQTAETPPGNEIVATGGAFTLEKTVVAGGGNETFQALIKQSGTAGQAVAGTRSNGGQFSLSAGFWTPESFVPTAATATIGGRVGTTSGSGIRNVRVTVIFPGGERRTTVSGSFGHYRFNGIPVGAVYTISVVARKYSFSQPSQIRQIMEDTEDIDFIADQIKTVDQ